MRVNTAGEYLEAADASLVFDDAVLKVVGCTTGVDAIQTQAFECRYNIFGHTNSVQFSYADVGVGQEWNGSDNTFSFFEVAVVLFEVRGALAQHAPVPSFLPHGTHGGGHMGGTVDPWEVQLTARPPNHPMSRSCVQVLSAGSSTLTGFIHTTQTSANQVSDVTAAAASVPLLTSSTSRVLFLNTAQQHILPTMPHLYRMREAVNPGYRALRNTQQATPLFDVDGDGRFSASDYLLLISLNPVWSNAAGAAANWLETFEGKNGGNAVSDWQLQSTDPDLLCAPATHPLSCHVHDPIVARRTLTHVILVLQTACASVGVGCGTQGTAAMQVLQRRSCQSLAITAQARWQCAA